MQAVTWNSGVGAMNTGGAAGSAGAAGVSPAATAARASAPATAPVMKTRCMMLATEPRWVIWAPLGNPVVPDV